MSGPSYHGRTHGFRLDENNKIVGYGTDPITFPEITLPNVTGDSLSDIILAGADLDAFWKLNESSGTTAVDSSPNGWDITVPTSYVAPTWAQAAGPPGEQTAGFVDGAADMLSRGTTLPAFPGYANDFTAEIWTRLESHGSNVHYLIGQGTPIGGGGTGWMLGVYGSGGGPASKMVLATNDGSGASTEITGNNALTQDGTVWYHLAITCTSGGLFTMYVDGASQAATTSAAFTAAQGVKIGDLGNGGGTESTYRLRGLASYAALWNRALSGAEILAHYEAGSTGGIVGAGYVWTSDGAGDAGWELPAIEVTY